MVGVGLVPTQTQQGGNHKGCPYRPLIYLYTLSPLYLYTLSSYEHTRRNYPRRSPR